MVPKTLNKTSAGFSLLELLIIITTVSILFGISHLVLNPGELQKRARDNKRLSDLSRLETILAEYKLDFGAYPDASNTQRFSTSLPNEVTGPATNPASGWINADLSEYTSVLPVDPLNADGYRYTYMHDGYTFEINARVEFLVDKAANDGGNDDDLYEIGDDLELI